jgi:hypothetical protein
MLRKRLYNLCDLWEVQIRNRYITAAAEETSHIGKTALEYGARAHYSALCELRDAIHPKFSFNFLFKIFQKNSKCPRAGRF